VIVGLLYGISRSIEQWYLFLPVIGLSLLVGTGADSIGRLWHAGKLRDRVLAASCGVALLGFSFCQLRYSPLTHAYPEWKVASKASREFLEKLARRIARKPPGAPIKAPPLPIWYPPPQQGPGIRGAAILDDYSVQAWLELVYPERRFRVLKGPSSTPLAEGESPVQLLRPYVF